MVRDLATSRTLGVTRPQTAISPAHVRFPGFQISNRHSTSGARDTPRHDTHARYNTIPALAGSVLAMRVLCRGVWVPGPIEGSSIGNPEPVEV